MSEPVRDEQRLPRLYCVHGFGQRYWVFRFGRWMNRLLDAVHVIRHGFMPS